MKDVNELFLDGKIISDIREQYSETGNLVMTFRVANFAGRTGKHLVIECKMFTAIADAGFRLGIKEGDRMFIQGRLCRRTFQSKTSFVERNYIFVIINRFRMHWPTPLEKLTPAERKRYKAMETKLGKDWIDPEVLKDHGLG